MSEACSRSTPPSIRSSTSRSSTSRRAAKSPSREAAKNASTTSRCRARSASGSGESCTRRRARLASCCAAASDRSSAAATSANGTPNTSCSTNASRSAGLSASSTTSSARPAGFRHSADPGRGFEAKPPGGHRRPRSPTRASDKQPRADATGAARSVPSATHARPSRDFSCGLNGRRRCAAGCRNGPEPDPAWRSVRRDRAKLEERRLLGFAAGHIDVILGGHHARYTLLFDRSSRSGNEYRHRLSLLRTTPKTRHPAVTPAGPPREALPLVVVAEVYDEGRHGHDQETDRARDFAVSHPDVRAYRADEEDDEADRGGGTERWQGEADEQSDRSAGLQDAERNHPFLRDPHLVRDNIDRLGADEVQRGGVAVGERHHDRDCDVSDPHTRKTRHAPRT